MSSNICSLFCLSFHILPLSPSMFLLPILILSLLFLLWGLQRWNYFNVLRIRGLQEWLNGDRRGKAEETFFGCQCAVPSPSCNSTFHGGGYYLREQTGHQGGVGGMRPSASAHKETSACQATGASPQLGHVIHLCQH